MNKIKNEVNSDEYAEFQYYKEYMQVKESKEYQEFLNSKNIKKEKKKVVTHYHKEWLKPKEFKKILALKTIPESYEVWLLLMYTPALRVSEAINVKYENLDLDSECVEIYGGKGKDSTVMQKAPCSPEVLKKIIRYCDHNKLRKNDYVMFSNKSKQVNRSQVYRVINKLGKEAGINKVLGTHSLRRSRAQDLLDSEYPIFSVSKYLRHKRIETTLSYLNLSIADLQRDLQKINDPINDILL